MPSISKIVLVAFGAALVGGAVAAFVIGNWAGWTQLRSLGEVRRQKLTEQDAENLKRLATALEEFAVDNNGRYPATLEQLGPPYLLRKIFIPGSNPAQSYAYQIPAADPQFGKYDLVDDGSFDPSLLKLANGVGGPLCTRSTCKYMIYAAGVGLIGSPSNPISTSATAPQIVPAATAEPIPRLVKRFLRGTYKFEQREPDVTSIDGLTNGWTEVLVTTDPCGNVIAAQVQRSSGSSAFDNAALEAARHTFDRHLGQLASCTSAMSTFEMILAPQAPPTPLPPVTPSPATS